MRRSSITRRDTARFIAAVALALAASPAPGQFKGPVTRIGESWWPAAQRGYEAKSTYAVDKDRLLQATLVAVASQGFATAASEDAGTVTTNLLEVDGKAGNFTASQQHRFGFRLIVVGIDATSSSLTIAPVIEASYKSGYQTPQGALAWRNVTAEEPRVVEVLKAWLGERVDAATRDSGGRPP